MKALRAAPAKSQEEPPMGGVYILHFARPISPLHTDQHYVGFAEDLDARIAQQRQGKGARFCTVARERNISFRVVEVLRGGRTLERSIKKYKKTRIFCPICQRNFRKFNQAKEK